MATLTAVNGVNAALLAANPASKLSVKQNYGRVRVLYDEYTVATADEFGTSGLLNLMKIPAGARVIDGRCVFPATGATGIFDIGWAVSADAVEAADADGLWAAIDPGAAAVDAVLPGSRPGWNKTFASEVQVQADCTEATADAGTLTFKVMLLIVVD